MAGASSETGASAQRTQGPEPPACPAGRRLAGGQGPGVRPPGETVVSRPAPGLPWALSAQATSRQVAEARLGWEAGSSPGPAETLSRPCRRTSCTRTSTTTSTWTTASTSAGSCTGPWTRRRPRVGSPRARTPVGLPAGAAPSESTAPGDRPPSRPSFPPPSRHLPSALRPASASSCQPHVAGQAGGRSRHLCVPLKVSFRKSLCTHSVCLRSAAAVRSEGCPWGETLQSPQTVALRFRTERAGGRGLLRARMQPWLVCPRSCGSGRPRHGLTRHCEAEHQARAQCRSRSARRALRWRGRGLTEHVVPALPTGTGRAGAGQLRAERLCDHGVRHEGTAPWVYALAHRAFLLPRPPRPGCRPAGRRGRRPGEAAEGPGRGRGPHGVRGLPDALLHLPRALPAGQHLGLPGECVAGPGRRGGRAPGAGGSGPASNSERGTCCC